MNDAEPFPFIRLGDAAIAAVDACARAFQTDGRDRPVDAEAETLWSPVIDLPDLD